VNEVSCNMQTYKDDLVSVVIPCYNNAEFVEAAIRSALNQSHKGTEIIVVNDGSTDESLMQIEKFHRDVVILDQPNSGACVARNNGVAIAKGKWIKFLDADDILKADCIERQLGYCQSDTTVVYGECEFIDASGNICANPAHSKSGSIRTGKFANLNSFFSAPMLTSTTLYPKAVLLEAGGFNPKVKRGQEHELHVRLYLNGVDFQYFPQICYQYRQHESLSRISVSMDKAIFLGGFANFKWLVGLAEHGPRGPEFDTNRLVLGRYACQVGRQRLRLGEGDIANQFFAEGRRISGSQAMHGSGLYKLCAKWMGPQMAEHISTLSYAFRRRFRRSA
jgi:glycosyltransferase involved in cell wall biosynthesis